MAQRALTLELTEDDVRAIDFAGYRYGWSEALAWCEVGENEIDPHKGARILDGFGQDIEGGHSLFPLLDPRSDLAVKLAHLLTELV